MGPLICGVTTDKVQLTPKRTAFSNVGKLLQDSIFQIGGGGRVPAVPNAGSAQKCACAAMSTLVRERSTWTSCLQCAKALCPMKVAPLGRLTSWTPDEWKHPIGMPAGRSEETPCL